MSNNGYNEKRTNSISDKDYELMKIFYKKEYLDEVLNEKKVEQTKSPSPSKKTTCSIPKRIFVTFLILLIIVGTISRHIFYAIY